MWTSLGKILPAKIRGLKLEKAMEYHKLEKGWDDLLDNALGYGWRQKAKPLRVRDKVLFVVCFNSVWVNELQLRNEILLKKIRQKFRGIEIEKIKVIG